MAGVNRQSVEDMTALSELTEETLVENLRLRFEEHLIYTYSGSILVAVNPFKRHSDMYTKAIMSKYYQHRMHENSPHVYGIAETALSNLRNLRKNQTILISGESGAGKTETMKFILEYLTKVTAVTGPTADNKGALISRNIMEMNVLLESFGIVTPTIHTQITQIGSLLLGNAKTDRNNNSSRFGKFVQVIMDEKGLFSGAVVQNYLLEKNRAVRFPPTDRSFHVFYELLTGASMLEHSKYKLLDISNYRYLKQGPATVSGKNDHRDYELLRRAIAQLRIDPAHVDTIFKILSVVLLIGNLAFEGEEHAKIAENEMETTFKPILDLLQCDESELQQCFIQRKIAVNSQVTQVLFTKSQAEENRDSVAKFLFDKLFSHIVKMINDKMVPPEGSKSLGYLGILDLYGFEQYNVNSFEQVCINYANEKLHQFFLYDVCKLEQDEYKKEGILWENVEFRDNQPCIELIEFGILGFLDDECKVPKGTDDTFLQKMNELHKNNPGYVRSKVPDGKFGIQHFPGEVSYTVEGFMDKNKDAVREDVISAISSSKSAFIQDLCRGGGVTKSAQQTSSSAKKMTTVGGSFKLNLLSLSTLLGSTTSHYIRCIKSNYEKAEWSFDDTAVMAQMRYSGMLAAVKVRKLGFNWRLTFEYFIEKFGHIVKQTEDKSNKETCMLIFRAVKIPEKQWKMGISKVFMQQIAFDELVAFTNKQFSKYAVVLQNAWRRKKAREDYLKQKYAATIVAKYIRRYRAQRAYEKLRTSTIIVQSLVRRWFARDFHRTLQEKKKQVVQETEKTKLVKLRETERGKSLAEENTKAESLKDRTEKLKILNEKKSALVNRNVEVFGNSVKGSVFRKKSVGFREGPDTVFEIENNLGFKGAITNQASDKDKTKDEVVNGESIGPIRAKLRPVSKNLSDAPTIQAEAPATDPKPIISLKSLRQPPTAGNKQTAAEEPPKPLIKLGRKELITAEPAVPLLSLKSLRPTSVTDMKSTAAEESRKPLVKVGPKDPITAEPATSPFSTKSLRRISVTESKPPAEEDPRKPLIKIGQKETVVPEPVAQPFSLKSLRPTSVTEIKPTAEEEPPKPFVSLRKEPTSASTAALQQPASSSPPGPGLLRKKSDAGLPNTASLSKSSNFEIPKLKSVKADAEDGNSNVQIGSTDKNVTSGSVTSTSEWISTSKDAPPAQKSGSRPSSAAILPPAPPPPEIAPSQPEKESQPIDSLAPPPPPVPATRPILKNNPLATRFNAESTGPEARRDLFREYADMNFERHERDGNLVPTDEMFVFTRDPINTPMTVFKGEAQKDLVEEACQAFAILLKILEASDQSAQDVLALQQTFLEKGIKHPQIRDELFVQICRLVKPSPAILADTDAWSKIEKNAWAMMFLASACFPPGKGFRQPLSHFMRMAREETACKPEVASIFDLIERCIDANKAVALNGPRKSVPSLEELVVLSRQRFMIQLSVFTFDGQQNFVDFSTYATVSDVVKQYCMEVGLRNQRGWSLHLIKVDTFEEVALPGLDFMCDLLGKHGLCKAAFEDVDPSGRLNGWKIYFKKHIFKDAPTFNPIEFDHLYHQGTFEYLSGKYAFDNDTLESLAAQKAQVEYGNYDEAGEYLNSLSNFLPKDVIESRPVTTWAEGIKTKYKELTDKDQMEARMLFLETLRRSPAYGSEIYAAKFSGHWSYSKSVSIAISARGFLILSKTDKELLEVVPFQRLSHWATDSEGITLYIAVGESVPNNDDGCTELYELPLDTDKADEISFMLKEYSGKTGCDRKRGADMYVSAVESSHLTRSMDRARARLISSRILNVPDSMKTGTIARLWNNGKSSFNLSLLRSPRVQSAGSVNSLARARSIIFNSESNDEMNWNNLMTKLECPYSRSIEKSPELCTKAETCHEILVSLAQKDHSDYIADENSIAYMARVRKILQLYLDDSRFAAELYLQVSSFLGLCGDASEPTEFLRYWKLLAVVTGFVKLPEQEIIDYIVCLLRWWSFAEDKFPASVHVKDREDYARYSIRAFRACMESEARKKLPSDAELKATMSRAKLSYRIHLLDKQYRTVTFDTFVTVNAVINAVLDRLDLEDAQVYFLHVVKGKSVCPYSPTARICDVVCEIPETPVDITVEPVSGAYLLVKRRIFKKDAILSQSDRLNAITLQQIIPDIAAGLLPFTLDDMVLPMALLCLWKGKKARKWQKKHYKAVIEKCSPRHLQENPKLLMDVRQNHRRLLKLVDQPKHIHRLILEDLASKWAHFGSSVYPIMQTFSTVITADSVIWLDTTGIYFANTGEKFASLNCEYHELTRIKVSESTVELSVLGESESISFSSSWHEDIVWLIGEFRRSAGLPQLNAASMGASKEENRAEVLVRSASRTI